LNKVERPYHGDQGWVAIVCLGDVQNSVYVSLKYGHYKLKTH